MEGFNKYSYFKDGMSPEDMLATQDLAAEKTLERGLVKGQTEDIRLEHTGKGWTDEDLANQAVKQMLEEKLGVSNGELVKQIEELETDLAVLSVKLQVGTHILSQDRVDDLLADLQKFKEKNESIGISMPKNINEKDVHMLLEKSSYFTESIQGIKNILSNNSSTISPEEERTLIEKYKEITQTIDTYKRFLYSQEGNNN